MQTQNNLRSLPIHKLSIWLEHLRLGEKHLKKRLTPEQFSELLNLTDLDSTQSKTVTADSLEKKGNITKAVDGLLTTIIGSWLGYIGFVESRLDSREAFIAILCLATAIGIYVGYYNYRLIKSREQESKISQKLHNLQHTILKIILEKKENTITHLTFFINSALKKINTSQEVFDAQEEPIKWLPQLIQILKNKYESAPTHNPIYSLCKTQLKTTLDGLEKLLNKNQKQKHNVKKNLFDILTNPKKISPREINSKPAWWQGHLKDLLTGVAPAFLGGFGSIYVYFGGIPEQAKKFGVPGADFLLKNPQVKVVEVVIGLLLAFYYALVFINNKRKAAKRQIELQATDKHITDLEKNIAERSKQLSLMKTIKSKLEEILFIVDLTQINKKNEEKPEPLATV